MGDWLIFTEGTPCASTGLNTLRILIHLTLPSPMRHVVLSAFNKNNLKLRDFKLSKVTELVSGRAGLPDSRAQAGLYDTDFLSKTYGYWLLPKVHPKCYLPGVCSAAGRCGMFTSLRLMPTLQPQTPKHLVHNSAQALPCSALCPLSSSPAGPRLSGPGGGGAVSHTLSPAVVSTLPCTTGIR